MLIYAVVNPNTNSFAKMQQKETQIICQHWHLITYIPTINSNETLNILKQWAEIESLNRSNGICTYYSAMAVGGRAQRLLSEAGHLGHCRPREVIIVPITIRWQ